mmetsp:Transcript_17944/g.18141  ORF Transcript_17944/g.18141 Transcript_17944/m.18141 type:complete len:120 (-) Transcript_17944:328-687(-)
MCCQPQQGKCQETSTEQTKGEGESHDVRRSFVQGGILGTDQLRKPQERCRNQETVADRKQQLYRERKEIVAYHHAAALAAATNRGTAQEETWQKQGTEQGTHYEFLRDIADALHRNIPR